MLTSAHEKASELLLEGGHLRAERQKERVEGAAPGCRLLVSELVSVELDLAAHELDKRLEFRSRRGAAADVSRSLPSMARSLCACSASRKKTYCLRVYIPTLVWVDHAFA